MWRVRLACRAMSRAKLSAAFLASLLALAAACGGKKDKPPVTPDDTSKTDSDGGTDMPSTSGTDTGSSDAGGGTTAEKPPEAKPPITVAAMKFTGAKGKKPKAIEVK